MRVRARARLFGAGRTWRFSYRRAWITPGEYPLSAKSRLMSCHLEVSVGRRRRFGALKTNKQIQTKPQRGILACAHCARRVRRAARCTVHVVRCTVGDAHRAAHIASLAAAAHVGSEAPQARHQLLLLPPLAFAACHAASLRGRAPAAAAAQATVLAISAGGHVSERRFRRKQSKPAKRERKRKQTTRGADADVESRRRCGPVRPGGRFSAAKGPLAPLTWSSAAP